MTPKPKPLPVKKRTSIGSRRNPEAEAAVLAAAKELISEKGYAGFSVDEVARRAGAGKTTIYRWYPTKADLFIAIYTAERTTFVAVPDTGSLVEDLVQYTTSLWRFWRSHPAGAALRGLIAEAQGRKEALAALRDRFLPERTADVKRILSMVRLCEDAIAVRVSNVGPFRTLVENTIAPLLPHAEATASNVAKRIGLSERTFARRLAGEGVAFGEILDGLRRELALNYLQEGLQASQIAWLLGFHQLSSFTHACRRWTGKCPSEHRRLNKFSLVADKSSRIAL